MAAEQEGMSVVDAVSEGRYQAMFALRNMFGVTDLEFINEGWVPVLTALQALPKQLIDEVGIPIIWKFFEDEALDPGKDYDRGKAEPFAPLIAASIGTAAQFVYENMQRQAVAAEQSRQRILTGRA